MNKERIIAIIPNVVYQGKRGMNHHVIYVSTRKIYIIRTRKGYDGIPFQALAIYYDRSDRKKGIDPKEFEYNDISSIKNHRNFIRSISLKRITDIKFIRTAFTFRFIVIGSTKDGKIRKLINGYLQPTQSRIDREKNYGYDKKRISYNYAFEVQNIIESIFPGKVTHRFHK
jgi:hypothetical protein